MRDDIRTEQGPTWAEHLPDPLLVSAQDVRARLGDARRLIVLDDDPTGTQTVRDVPVLTSWRAEDVEWALDQGGPGFFILTNTRSLGEHGAADRNREVATACYAAARRRGIEIAFASRGDSTLRGHFPLETDVLSEVSAGEGSPVDAVLLAPAYLDAGRITLNGTHWLRDAEGLHPVGESEFARDATFGYRSSWLPEWVAEKSGGRVPADAVTVVGLEAIRSAGAPLASVLRASRDGAVVVVDAVTDDDLRSAVVSALDAESSGIRIVYRVGPSFVRARLGQGSQPPLDDLELANLLGAAGDSGTVARHGLVAIGSHVDLSNRQLAALTTSREVHAIELDVEKVLGDDAQAHIAEVASLAAAWLDDRVTVISTSRGLRRGADAATSLDLSRRVSAALTETVRRTVLARRPAYVIAKGGITSSDIATDALGISRARVVGSMLPGIVSVWQAASGAATGLPYVVFAGNVGDDASLATVVDNWERARELG